jgi:hypothetical protein
LRDENKEEVHKVNYENIIGEQIFHVHADVIKKPEAGARANRFNGN